MVVNIEWPGFKSHAFEYLEEDRELDSQSHRPGEQAFEKLTSGLYMGEIARRILLRYGLRLSNGQIAEYFHKVPGQLPPDYISRWT